MASKSGRRLGIATIATKAALRKSLVEELGRGELTRLAGLFKLDAAPGAPLKAYPGSQNVVYPCFKNGARHYLRVSFREDRCFESQAAELAFVDYLRRGGARVAGAVPSERGGLLERFEACGLEARAALFEESAGDFLCRRGWSLPEGAKLPDYFFNQGALLGTIHALSSVYPGARGARRFDWLERHRASVTGPGAIEGLLPEPLARKLAARGRERADGGAALPSSEELRRAIVGVIDEIASLDRSAPAFGLCHNDFNDGNFTVDYSRPPSCELTLFDFDDCGFNYYMYDFACLWEANTGFAIAGSGADASAAERMARMEAICGHLVRGYRSAFALDDATLALLPLFLRACHVENLLEPFRERLAAGKRAAYDAETRYHAACLVRGIGWLGLFDPIFDPGKPFELD